MANPVCVTVGPVNRTVGILAYSRLKALAVNGGNHPADVGHMLAYLGSTHTNSKLVKGISSLATDSVFQCEIFCLL